MLARIVSMHRSAASQSWDSMITKISLK